MFINSIALLQEFWSINKMLYLYTSHHLSSFFSFYSPFTFQKFNSYLALSNPLCSQVFSVKQWSSHSSSSDDLVNEILLPYHCDPRFSSTIIFGAQTTCTGEVFRNSLRNIWKLLTSSQAPRVSGSEEQHSPDWIFLVMICLAEWA